MGLLACLGCQSGGSQEKSIPNQSGTAKKEAPRKEESIPEHEFGNKLQIKDSELEAFPRSSHASEAAPGDLDGDFYSAAEDEEQIPTHVDRDIPSGIRM